MARKTNPTSTAVAVVINEGAIAQDQAAQNQLAALTLEAQNRTRAVAQQLGYQLPADCTDPDLIQRDIAANMRRSVEAVLQVGIGLRVLKEACAHGDFLPRLEALGVEPRLAQRLMQAAGKFSNASTSPLLKAAGTQSKLLELLVLDDDQVEELELLGQTGELSLDDVAAMSVKELRKALRDTKAEREADKAMLDKKQARIDKLEREAGRIDKLPPDDLLAHQQQQASRAARHVSAIVQGELRQSFIAAENASMERGTQTVFLAGLVGQIAAHLAELRQEFNLPDVSTAAEAELAAEVAQWAKKR